jgi:NADPH-dependent curcumin reductase CurA
MPEEGEVPVPASADGQVRNLLLSVDPAMRGWVSSVANYSDPVPVVALCGGSPWVASPRHAINGLTAYFALLELGRPKDLVGH